jgi:hypothetical protein
MLKSGEFNSCFRNMVEYGEDPKKTILIMLDYNLERLFGKI